MFHKTVKLILKGKYVHTVNALDWKTSIALCILREAHRESPGTRVAAARVSLNILLRRTPREPNGILYAVKRHNGCYTKMRARARAPFETETHRAAWTLSIAPVSITTILSAAANRHESRRLSLMRYMKKCILFENLVRYLINFIILYLYRDYHIFRHTLKPCYYPREFKIFREQKLQRIFRQIHLRVIKTSYLNPYF